MRLSSMMRSESDLITLNLLMPLQRTASTALIAGLSTKWAIGILDIL
jgi:hypothetical protein